MKTIVASFVLSIGLLFHLTAYGQRTPRSFTFKVYVNNATAGRNGGQTAIKNLIIDQFARVSQLYNQETRFTNTYTFTASSFQFYDEVGANQNVMNSYAAQPAETGQQFRIIYSDAPYPDSPGGYPNIVSDYNVTTRSIRYALNAVAEANNWGSPDLFGTVPTRILCHELGHTRGAADLYAVNVNKDNNAVNNTIFYDHPTPSIMNYLYDLNAGWDTHSIASINASAGNILTAATWKTLFWSQFPSTMSVRVKNSQGALMPNTKVTLYGVKWLTTAINTSDATVYYTDAQGKLSFDLTNAANNPFKQNNDVFATYSNFMVVVGNQTASPDWLNIFNVQTAKINGTSEYILDVVATGSPTVSITSPANNASFTAPASITLNATASDAGGSISKVEFYNGSTLLYSDASSPYSYNWTGVAAGTYSITARATDNSSLTTTSSAVTVNVTGSNTPPTVSITSPANNASFAAPASITINATAADANGTVSKVDFYNGATLLFSDVSSPYSYSWTGVAAGTYTLTAKATDNGNATTTSSAVTVNVTGGNTAPTVSITSPANNATFTAPASITINATAADANGTVSKVDFYNGATLLFTDVTSPYSYSWTGVAAGTYTLTAKATDNGNATTTSSAVTVVVNTGTTASDFCFEAESAVGQSTFALFQVLNDVNAGGGKYIVVPNGTGNQSLPPTKSIATFSFNVPATATYYYWIRVIATTSNDNSLHIRTDANSFESYTPGTYTSWTWKKWSSSSLTTGSHSISIANYEDGLQIDKIIVSKSSSTPTGFGCGASARMDELADALEKADMNVTTLLVAPNPSSESFSISTTDQAISSLTVSSTWGVEVFSARDIAKGTKTEFGTDLASGMYTVHVRYENGKAETLKVIKLK